jgi:type 1 glutamine amidotransferase
MKTQIYLSFNLIIIFMISAFSAATAQNQFEVLVLAIQDQYHNDALPTGILSIKDMAVKHQFGFTWTMDPDVLTGEGLKDIDVVVFFNAKPDRFTEEQKQGLKAFVNNGGGFVGIHAASTTRGDWTWYKQLVGRVFTDHPRLQSGILQTTDKEFLACLHLPEKWIWSDEWYNYGEDQSDNLHDILVVDESTYDTTWGYDVPITGMGDYHPVAWYHEFDGGRSFYSGLGHKPEHFLDERYLEFLYGAILWAAKGK